MPIQKAVASSVKTPGFYLLVDLLGRASNPGTAANLALIIASKSSAGNITPSTEVRRCNGPGDVATALGPGTPGHLAAKRLFQRYGFAAVDVVAPAESAGAAATATITVTGPATENSNVRFRIVGRTIDVPWLNAESAATFVARAVVAINELSSDLPAVASDAGSGSILLTAKLKGPWGNDIRTYASVTEGGGGIAITANPTNATGGTTEPSLATVLALVSTVEYARIVPCLSNADASDATSSSNAERLADHINARETGLGAKLQVGVIGHTGSIANAKAGAIDRNNEAVQYVLGRGWDDLPCEIAAHEAGDALAGIAIRPNYNRIGNTCDLYGPRDVVTNKLSQVETEDLLSNGVTPLDVDALTGARFLVAPITSHSTSSGAPDYRAYYLSDTDGMYAVFRDLRTAVPQQFPNCSITEDLPPGATELPAGVVERKDVEAFVISRLRFWARQGVVSAAKLDASIANGELIVQIDESNTSQVNMFIPTGIIAPLAKFGMVGSKVA